MPLFDLTTRQRRALRTLDWLWDTRDEHRRTGRSTVLALSYLRRLVFQPNDNRWVEVEDHADGGRHLDQMLVRQVVEMGRRCGLDIEVAPSNRIRLHGGVSRAAIEAITEFGDLPEDALQPRDQFRHRAERAVVFNEMLAAKPAPPPAPQRTLWDHLTED